MTGKPVQDDTRRLLEDILEISRNVYPLGYDSVIFNICVYNEVKHQSTGMTGPPL